METQRRGSVKIMTPDEPGVIRVKYTNQFSAFDRGTSPQEIPGIGAARCACAVKSFRLAQAKGLPTHFIEQEDDTTFLVQEFSVPGQASLSGKVEGMVLPLEWIWRDLLYGSLWERFAQAKITAQDLGFAPGTNHLYQGIKLPRLRMECTTKFEAVDRHLTDAEARALANLVDAQWNAAWELISHAISITSAGYTRAGFMRPDGKLELGMKPSGDIVLVDVFGTPDEDRIIDNATGEIYSKDLIRNALKHADDSRWYMGLLRAKKEFPGDKSMWPPYPELPDDLVQLVSQRYGEVARRYAVAA